MYIYLIRGDESRSQYAQVGLFSSYPSGTPNQMFWLPLEQPLCNGGVGAWASAPSYPILIMHHLLLKNHLQKFIVGHQTYTRRTKTYNQIVISAYE